jgi:glutamyl-tRNA synthetase
MVRSLARLYNTGMTSTVRTRIAPSPTGIAHVGTLYMALFNYAFAHQNGGQFLVRIEDTDRGRFVEGAEQVIFDALAWAGITPDESPVHGGPHAPYRQSERLDIYKKYVDQLIEAGHAYYCFATPDELKEMREAQMAAGQPPKYDGRYRDYPMVKSRERIAAGEPYVVRMRVPEGESVWDDAIRGEVRIQNTQIDDQVIMKSDSYPTYHLAVVVDDYLMGITHVMRGEEWISSTPKHLLLYQMFGWPAPVFAHMPLLRNPDRSKLSKRKNDVSIVSYRDKGYLPEALLNFLMLLGWSHPEGKEFITLEEFIKDFSMERMQQTGPIFDLDKLNWMNGKYLREHLTEAELLSRLTSWLPTDCTPDMARNILPLVRERLITLADWEMLTAFFYRDITHSAELLTKKADAPLVKEQLALTQAAIDNLPSWDTPSLETALRSLQEQHEWKKSQYFMMIRVSVTGQTATPPLFETMEALGKDRTITRLQQAAQTV